MKHRERVMIALNHQEPDRCPMQISFTPEFASRLEADAKSLRDHAARAKSRAEQLEWELAEVQRKLAELEKR